MQTTTVAAVSTPRGKGGVAMLRVSGPDARAVLARVFRSRGDVPLRPRTAVYGSFYDDGGVFDDGIAVFCPACGAEKVYPCESVNAALDVLSTDHVYLEPPKEPQE